MLQSVESLVFQVVPLDLIEIVSSCQVRLSVYKGRVWSSAMQRELSPF